MQNSYSQRPLTVQGQMGHWTKYSTISGEDGQDRITVTSKFYEAIFVLSFGKTYAGVVRVQFKRFGLIRKFRRKQWELCKSRKHDLWGWGRGKLFNLKLCIPEGRWKICLCRLWISVSKDLSIFYLAFILYWERIKHPVVSHSMWFSTVKICRSLSSGSARNKSPGHGPCFSCNLLWWSVGKSISKCILPICVVEEIMLSSPFSG